MGKTRKLKAREKLARREKGKRKAALPLPSFLLFFFFRVRSFSIQRNRPDGHILLVLGVAVLDSELTVTMLGAS